jgi:hypothetical protein
MGRSKAGSRTAPTDHITIIDDMSELLHICLLLFAVWLAQEEKPLPEAKTFLAEFRKTLHSDNRLLSQYTYTEKETEIALDSKGNTRKTETNVYQMIHGAEDWQTYRRQIVKNGVPLSEKDLEKQDREEKDRVAKEARKRENESAARHDREKAKADREEQETLDDVFAMYDTQVVRRELLDSVATILVTFKTKPDYKPKTSIGKILQHVAGQAWIAEEDHELAKIQVEAIDPISFAAGLLARLQKGSSAVFERRKINNEIWLPVREEDFVNGRILLLKGLNLRDITEYSDYRKYSVDTILKFGETLVEPNR